MRGRYTDFLHKLALSKKNSLPRFHEAHLFTDRWSHVIVECTNEDVRKEHTSLWQSVKKIKTIKSVTI